MDVLTSSGYGWAPVHDSLSSWLSSSIDLRTAKKGSIPLRVEIREPAKRLHVVCIIYEAIAEEQVL